MLCRNAILLSSPCRGLSYILNFGSPEGYCNQEAPIKNPAIFCGALTCEACSTNLKHARARPFTRTISFKRPTFRGFHTFDGFLTTSKNPRV